MSAMSPSCSDVIIINRINVAAGTDNLLGTYLKDRRIRLDPAAFGLPLVRRRTPGLRREEVAQRANISPTWYTWLEQGRGGAPSADVLNRIAGALMLTDVEREHLSCSDSAVPLRSAIRRPKGLRRGCNACSMRSRSVRP
jgi:transcriptional regulator with XRE-family HTH domain